MKTFKNNKFTPDNSIDDARNIEYITEMCVDMKVESEKISILYDEERLEKIKTLCYN